MGSTRREWTPRTLFLHAKHIFLRRNVAPCRSLFVVTLANSQCISYQYTVFLIKARWLPIRAFFQSGRQRGLMCALCSEYNGPLDIDVPYINKQVMERASIILLTPFQLKYIIKYVSTTTREKGRDQTPVTKTPTPTEQSKKATWQHKNATKPLITQLLRTDLGRSVGVTAVTQLVWLNQSNQPSHSPQK